MINIIEVPKTKVQEAMCNSNNLLNRVSLLGSVFRGYDLGISLPQASPSGPKTDVHPSRERFKNGVQGECRNSRDLGRTFWHCRLLSLRFAPWLRLDILDILGLLCSTGAGLNRVYVKAVM